MTFDKQIKRRDLLKTSAMLGIAGAAGSVAPSLLKAEPAKPKEIIVRAWGWSLGRSTEGWSFRSIYDQDRH